MTISTPFPSDNIVPGTSFSQDYVSGARGLVPLDRRVLLIGSKKAGGTWTANAAQQFFTEAEIDAGAGAGSVLALMGRGAMRAARDAGGGSPEFHAIGLDEPGGGTAANNGTFTVTGAATASGDIVFSIAGKRMSAPVASGASPTTAAAAMAAAVLANLAELPGTLAAALGVATYTHGVKGVTGNDVSLRVHKIPPGLAIAVVQPSNGAGALTYTTALTNALNVDYNVIAIESSTSTEITALLTHMAEAWDYSRKRWRFAFVGSRVSVANLVTLAGTANDHRILVVGQPDSAALPAVMAACTAAVSETRTKPNQNYNGVKIPAIAAVEQGNGEELIASEIQTLMAGGVTPLALAEDGTGVTRLVSLITTKKTEGGNPFLNLLFYDAPKTVVYVMRQLDVLVSQVMAGRNVDAVLVRDVKGAAYATLKECETLGYVHNVDAHAREIQAEPDPVNVRRINLAYPTAPIPIANQVHGVGRLFIEAPVAAAA